MVNLYSSTYLTRSSRTPPRRAAEQRPEKLLAVQIAAIMSAREPTRRYDHIRTRSFTARRLFGHSENRRSRERSATNYDIAEAYPTGPTELHPARTPAEHRREQQEAE